MSSKVIGFRVDEMMEDALEKIRAELDLRSLSQAARYAIQIGLDKHNAVNVSIRKAAFVEGEIAGRAAFKAKLSALFTDEDST